MTSRTLTALALALSGCAIDDSLLSRLEARHAMQGQTDAGQDAASSLPDTGMMETDAGPTNDAGVDGGLRDQPSDRCGDMSATQLSNTRAYKIDTTGLENDVRFNAPRTPGNDGFYRFDATSGSFWHFHLMADTPGRDPILYVLQASSGICQSATPFLRNACSGGEGDEHFAFTAPADGTYFLGVDDGNMDGGRYTLEVVRPQCGNGPPAEHGEPCDLGPMNSDSGSCTMQCRIRLYDADGTSTTSVPAGAPHNDTADEAMLVDYGAGLDVRGRLLDGDCYPDVFAVSLTPGMFRVQGRDASNPGSVGMPAMGACVATAQAGYSLELRNAIDSVIATSSDSGGCLTLSASIGNTGVYHVWLQRTDTTPRSINYVLRFGAP